MKIKITIFLCLHTLILTGQFNIMPNFSWNKDQDQYIVGLQLSHILKTQNRLSLLGGINIEYAFEKNSKTLYFDNYMPNNLDEDALRFIEYEHFLLRERRRKSIYISPEILIQYYFSKKRKNKFDILLFSGINSRIQLHDKSVSKGVDYSDDLTEISKWTDTNETRKIQIYNWYFPIGLSLEMKKIPIYLSTSFDIALRRKSSHQIYYLREKRHHNLNIGVGIRL